MGVNDWTERLFQVSDGTNTFVYLEQQPGEVEPYAIYVGSREMRAVPVQGYEVDRDNVIRIHTLEGTFVLHSSSEHHRLPAFGRSRLVECELAAFRIDRTEKGVVVTANR